MTRQSRSLSLIVASLALSVGCSARPSSSPSADSKRAEAGPEAARSPQQDEPMATMPSPGPEGKGDQPSGAAPALSDAMPTTEAELGPARLEVGEPMIDGGLNRDIIRRKAQDHADDLRACHASALAGDPTLAGTVALEFSVDARGIVTDVELGDTTDLADRAVVDCILEHVAGWSFAGDATGAATFELSLELAP